MAEPNPTSPVDASNAAERKRKEKEDAKREKEEAKRRALKEREDAAAAKAAEALEAIKDNFGFVPLVQSTTYATQKFIEIPQLNKSLAGSVVTVRARLQTVRAKGKLAFILLRHTPFSVQAVLAQSDTIPKEALKWVGSLNPESIADVTGLVTCPEVPIATATQQDVELQVQRIFIVSAAPPALPFQLEDAARREEEGKEGKEKAKEKVSDTASETSSETSEARREKAHVVVEQDTRLNCRWLDLRTKANNSIFRIQSAVGQYFREYLIGQGFVEIHTPKIIGAASEGGANVFKLGYFGKDAFLAQSPQLYKQMALQCDLHRVFEVAPVFRAEDSNTHRHLTEFMGLDVELTIKEHYYEVLDVAEELFVYIFTHLNENCRYLLDLVREQHPFEDLVFQVPEDKVAELGLGVIETAEQGRDPGKIRNRAMRVLRLSYPDGVKIINAKLPDLRVLPLDRLFEEFGIKAKDEEEKAKLLADMADDEDLSTSIEKLLGRQVKEKYGVDFFILDRYPSCVRPFYTMACADDTRFTNSYDFFIRGEEILSGAQRIHDADLLLERAQSLKVDMTPIMDYVNSFRLGAYPHGGFGVGLERVVMLFLGLHNIRKASMFPRDPKRNTP
eukprot:TRINITY_DN80958_c0_g1_i1.p1 TRINITY_DN80958_c0_g1~~TRINITY_DN80958_c0_g1_i1.p1  ORF type:complete len:618 (-),score=183.75 TRINITY_DN80958_c0_g1_i1:28-1881(-)